jgi:hypothetical protein
LTGSYLPLVKIFYFKPGLSGSRFKGSKVQGSRFRVQGSRFRVQGLMPL